MTNWKDPVVAAKTDQAYVKLLHVLLGITIWEIVTTCDYELDVLRRRRKYRWTIWIYLCCRVSYLGCFAVLVIEKDISGLRQCRAWDLAGYIIAYFALGSSSLLMLLRIPDFVSIAIWNRSTFVSAASFFIWLSSIGLNIWDLTTIRSQYVPLAGECIPINSAKAAPSVIGALVADTILFLVMLGGILRHRGGGMGVTGLWSLLWNQGLVWLSLAIVSEVPMLVFILLDLNDAWDVMFEVVTGSTRMHRILTDYHSGSTSTDFVQTQSLCFGPPLPVNAVHVRKTTTGDSDVLTQNIAVELGSTFQMVPDAETFTHQLPQTSPGRNPWEFVNTSTVTLRFNAPAIYTKHE
ncbi:hypothetical protein FA95DRAFT_1576701 [Auriscalpium vulgare]|uniref:Uncharacterized protein n=1 Tax=Auriscalpium vulgare TaxID=40419 RepID=A0ACB8RA27_9AGAM|nr:hypothetical protein FA95DRAFT_1576701 [Auriscalpium vulgare]